MAQMFSVWQLILKIGHAKRANTLEKDHTSLIREQYCEELESEKWQVLQI